MKIKFGKKVLDVDVKEVGTWGMGIGLMFKTKDTKNLLFNFTEDVQILLHSWFVFFDFYALWLNEKNEVIEFRKIKPFTTIIACSKPFRRIVEIPINQKNAKFISFVDGKQNI